MFDGKLIRLCLQLTPSIIGPPSINRLFVFHEPSGFISTDYNQCSQLREASPSFVRVPPPDPGGAISSVCVPPPEPLPCRLLGGNGLPRGVRGRPFSLLQQRNRPQTPPVPDSAARSLDMLIRSSNATLKLSGSVTCILRGKNFISKTTGVMLISF